MGILKFINSYKYLFIFLFSACASETKNNDKFEKMAVKSGLTATEEELSVLKSESGLDYKLELFSAYAGDEGALKKIIELRLDRRHRWDGAASDAFSNNLIIIAKKIGDDRFHNLIKNNIEWNKSKLIKIIFPAGDDGKIVKMYVDMLPLTYKYLLD